MTLIVIAIALAMPTGLYLLLKNASEMSAGWKGAGQVNIFLTAEIDRSGAEQAAEAIRDLQEVAAVTIVTPEQALAEFKAASEFSDALDALAENPLPFVLLADLRPRLEGPRIEALTSALETRPEVDFAQFDMQWLIRFNAILRSLERLIHVIASLLITGVLLIVGNTIRLDIENRREEIEITRMLGGTNAFIRRPFLYGGVWYGLLGGLMAWGLIGVAMVSLAGPLDALASAYDRAYRFRSLTGLESLALVAMAMAVGWLGARLAVGRHLARADAG